ncbi:MAG: ABC transporter ATP-binding protein [Anaerococcus sp.]|uniref:ABC transporter ATP-binding protein n=1 Tax=Anaerococcus sp. TaxID=1872515 RepID=UPI0029141D3A|nr:ABC transporter ATP-binding protein [Anaerococcus sp.]MDU7411624.1 ABC transporter ATP-binding protein [Anaerococcus sp.]
MKFKRILVVKYLNKIYGTTNEYITAVNDISLDLLEGEFLGIMGVSGSGKTTLLNMISGVVEATNGQIIFDGKNLNKFSRKDLEKYRGNEVTNIFQDYRLIENMTALENIEVPFIIHNKEIDMENIEKLAKKLDVYDCLNKYPKELSGGQKQRIAAIRAISINPKIILADEPTSALDTKNSRKFLKVLKNVNECSNISIIMATHDINAASICSRILFLKDGKIYNEISKKDRESIKDYKQRINLVSKQIIK